MSNFSAVVCSFALGMAIWIAASPFIDCATQQPFWQAFYSFMGVCR